MTEQEEYYREIGTKFGYPQCCIEAFIKDMEELNNTGRIASRDVPGVREKWAFQGFIPCAEHAKFIEQFGYAEMAGMINKNRNYLYPFPIAI